MDNTTSLNTPEVSTASQQQLHNYEDEALEVNLASSLEVNPASFDPALFLDETIDFMDPQATKQENVPEFDDINTWTEQVLAEVLDMENQHQQQQQQQQQQQHHHHPRRTFITMAEFML